MSGRRRPGTWWLLPLMIAVIAPRGAVAEEGWRAETDARAGPWRPVTSAQGKVRAWREIALEAPFALTVVKVAVQSGQSVASGQLLARFSSFALGPLAARVRETEQRLAFAGRRLQDIRERLTDKLATRADLLQAEIDRSQARSDADSAWQALQESLSQLGQPADRAALAKQLSGAGSDDPVRGWSTVRSPLDAFVAERAVADGSRVAAGALLFRLDDLSRVIVEVAVARQDADRWLHGTATVDVAGGEALELTPLAELPEIDPETGLARLHFEADNQERQLLDGEWATVRMSGPVREVAWVPSDAVVSRGGKTYCIRQRDNGFEPVEVTVGPEEDGRVPVLEGVEPGDRVVTDGAYLLLYRDLDRLQRFQD